MLGRRPTLLLWTVVGLLLATTGAATDEDDTADTIIVRRGQMAEITGHLVSGIRQHCSAEEDCQVSILGNNSRRCGYLQPERFNTSSDDVPVIFSHFGCGETHVPLDFRILRPDGEVRFATLEVTVAPSNHPLSPIMRSIQIVPLRTEDETGAGKVTFNLSVTFYTRVTWQECSYSISFYPFYLQVPERGRLVGNLVNERIPCGYEPLTPIQYETKQTNANDYLLVILWDKQSSAATTPLHGIVKIKMRALQYNHRHTHLASFSVHQTGYTFVPSHILIPPPYSLASLPANIRLYSSSTSCGRFVTPFSPRSVEDDSHTLITRDDLRSNAVAFHQLFTNCSEINYHLQAHDVAGVLLWKMVVKAMPHAVQTATTLHYVAHEGSTLNITSMLLGLSESFDDQCTFRMLHELESGDVLWRTAHGLNNSASGKKWSQRLETGTLWYTAGGQNDALVWEVACVNQPFIHNVTAFFTVIGKDKLPLITGFEKSEVHVYEGFATQLGSRLFHWTDPDTDDFAAVYQVPSTNLSILDVNISNPADTILPLADLDVQVNARSKSNDSIMFSHADWLNGHIWIAARHNSGLEYLRIFVYSLHNKCHELFFNIHLHSTPPPEPLSSFKKATAVRVVIDTNLPLTLSDESISKHTIYETFLKARVQGPVTATPIPIVYHIHVSPQHGYICVDPCEETAHNFTQLDIQSLSVHYVRRNTSEIDAFSFYLDDSDGQTHWFVIRTSHGVVPVDPCRNDRLYIPVPKGGSTTLTVESFQHSLSEDAALEVVMPPQHGLLTLTSFTLSALYAGNVTFILHNSSQVVCSDEIAFTVSANSSRSIFVLRFAVMTATSNPVTVSALPKRIHFDNLATLSASDVAISGVPFCPELVHVQVTSEPLFGTLQTSDAFDLSWKLKEGCSFSQLQLQQNKVTYKILGNDSSFRDRISFLVTVPLIGDDFNITTEEFTMDIHYSAQRPGQLMVAPQLPVRPVDDLLYGVIFEINKTINVSLPEDANPNQSILIFRPTDFYEGSFTGQVRRHGISVVWPYLDITVPLVYSFNISSLPQNKSSIQIDVLMSAPQFFQRTSVRVYWSRVSFVQNRVKLEARQEQQEISIGIQRVGSITEMSEVMIHTTYTDKAIILECPPGQEYCISNSSDGTTTVTFLPNIERVAVTLRVSMRPGWRGNSASVRLELMGVVSAVPLPPLDQMTIELLEYSWIQFSEPLNSSHAFGPQMDCDFITTVEEPSSPATISLRITRQGNLAERIGVVCYTSYDYSLFQDYEERHKHNPNSIVYFEPNATDAICDVRILSDRDPEGTEKFTVGLQAISGSWSHVNTSANSICVFITDTDSESEVFFTQAVIREKEPDQETIDTVVTLRRELLVDYGVQTTVYYRTVPGSATKDEDYIHEDSVIVFHGHQAEAYITLRILPGREWFKQESFSLEIYRVEEGVIEDLGGVVTVIIDGGEVVVGFAEEEYSFLDINGGVKIPVLRHGNLSIETSFYCLLQNISLSNSSSATAGEDYTTNIKRLHVLTFHSGQNTSYCSLHIADDTLRGGTQVLRVALVPVTDHIEHYVRFDSRSAIIREIAEVLRFSERFVTVAEPVTNFDIDNEPLNAIIMRERDNTMETTVGVRIYSPTANTAYLGRDFELLSDVVVFRPGEVQASIPVRILATPMTWSEMKLLFELELWPTGGNRWTKRETAINPQYSKLAVLIEDQRFRGPFFPALPVISSTKRESYEDDNHQEGALSALFPLTCITPCDQEWPGTRDYTEFCQNESIDTLKTQFVWEVSRDGGNTFTELNLTLSVASAKSHWLDPIFMSPGQYYRCKATAGTLEGQSNHVRMSKPVRVYAKAVESCSRVLPRIQVEIAPLGQQQQTTFTSTDVVELVIRLSRIDNMFPLVSTSTFSHDLVETQRSIYSRRRHKCSNFVLREIHSFWGSKASAPHPLLEMYQSLSAICDLEFRSWHRITDLVQECSKEVTEPRSGPNRRYKLAFHVAYFNATHTHLRKSFSANISRTVIIQPASVENSHPLHAATAMSSLEAILEPLDLAVRKDLSLEVILRSTIFSNTGSQFAAESFGSGVTSSKKNIYFSLSLVATSNSNKGNMTQLWRMTSKGISTDYSGNYTVKLVCQPQPFSTASPHCLRETKGHQFRFRIDRSNSSRSRYHFSPTTELSLAGTSGGDTFSKGDFVNATVAVTGDQIVQSNLEMKIKCVLLCHDPCSPLTDTPGGCVTVYKRDSPGAGWNLSINAHNRLRVSFSFEMESLQVGCWQLVANYMFVRTLGDGQYTSLGESSVSTKLSITVETTPAPSSNPTSGAINSSFENIQAFFIGVLLIFGVVCIFGIVALTLVFLKWRNKHLVDPPRYNARVFRHSTTRTCVMPSGKVEAGVTVEMAEISCSSSRSDHLHSALDLVGEGRTIKTQIDDRGTGAKFCSLPQLCPERDNGTVDRLSSQCKDKECASAVPRILPVGQQPQDQELTAHIERTLAATAPSPAQSHLAIQTDL